MTVQERASEIKALVAQAFAPPSAEDAAEFAAYVLDDYTTAVYDINLLVTPDAYYLLGAVLQYTLDNIEPIAAMDVVLILDVPRDTEHLSSIGKPPEKNIEDVLRYLGMMQFKDISADQQKAILAWLDFYSDPQLLGDRDPQLHSALRYWKQFRPTS